MLLGIGVSLSITIARGGEDAPPADILSGLTFNEATGGLEVTTTTAGDMYFWIGTTAVVSKADVIAGTGATIEVGPLVVDGGLETATVDLGPLSGGTDYYLHVAMDLADSNVVTLAFTMELEVNLITVYGPTLFGDGGSPTSKSYTVDLSPYRAGDLVVVFSQVLTLQVLSCTVGGADALEVEALNDGQRKGAVFKFTMTGDGSATTEVVITPAAAASLDGYDILWVVPDGEVSGSSVAADNTFSAAPQTLSTSVTAPAVPNGILSIGFSARNLASLTVDPPTEVASAASGDFRVSAGFSQDVAAGTYVSTVSTTHASRHERAIIAVALRAV